MVSVLLICCLVGCKQIDLRSLSFVQVYKVEFKTWEDELLRQYALPMVFFFRLMIRGDLVMIHMSHSVQITLLNWRTGSVLLLNFTNNEVGGVK